jgi:hypothetical protein
MDVMLSYYLHIDPSALADDEWVMKIKALEYIRKQESEHGTDRR